MVLNSSLVVTVANISANLCQYIACNPERVSTDEALNLIFCLPFHHLGRLALSLWTYLCYNPNPSNLSDFNFNEDDDADSHSD